MSGEIRSNRLKSMHAVYENPIGREQMASAIMQIATIVQSEGADGVVIVATRKVVPGEGVAASYETFHRHIIATDRDTRDVMAKACIRMAAGAKIGGIEDVEGKEKLIDEIADVAMRAIDARLAASPIRDAAARVIVREAAARMKQWMEENHKEFCPCETCQALRVLIAWGERE